MLSTYNPYRYQRRIREKNSMDLKTLKDSLPWDWPESAGKMILDTLCDNQARKSDRLLAAIDATVKIHPQEASEILSFLTNSDDEDIVEAVDEALTLAGHTLEDEDYDEDDNDKSHR
jgi:hypothetical protein